jgi:hypothetical protein
MFLNLILSKIKLFFKSSFGFRKNKENIEKEELDKRKKYSILQLVFDNILKRIIVSRNKKRLDLSKRRYKKKSSKDLKKKEIEKDNTKYDNMSFNKNFNYIEKLVKNYEEFTKRDLFAVIIEANATLRKWKSDLVEMISKSGELQKVQMLGLANNLQEISELYIDAQNTLDVVSNKFVNYQSMVKDSKRLISPQHTLNQLQSQIDKVILGLEKGKYLADLNHNNDYKYLYKHAHDKNDNSRHMSL